MDSKTVAPLYTAKKVTQTTMMFYPLALHPKALRFEQRVDDQLTAEGVVRLVMFEHFQRAGKNLVEAFTDYKETDEFDKSLPRAARYWLVQKERLEAPEGDRDLFDDIDGWQDHLDDPDYVLVYKSLWNHSLWNIDGCGILMPMELSVWGTRYDLGQVAKHVRCHPAVTSFSIVPNTCWQNHEISGTHLGKLVVDPRKFDRVLLPSVVTRSWLQHMVVDGYSDKEHDLLGLASLRKAS